MKLWQKEESIDKVFERFTVGKDPELDVHLAKFDIMGSRAHTQMLGEIGLLTLEEVTALCKELDNIAQQILAGDFKIEDGVEDCHSQIELLLTAELGDIGKKIHSGRSRNDQVLTALKLFAKAELREIVTLTKSLFDVLITLSERHKEVLMPGYTHMQVAMPSSFGLWFSAYAESLIDDLIQLKASYQLVDKNPLGSAAGYGSSFPLDRLSTTKKMGFEGLNINAIYAQMTRGKMEKSVAFTVNSLAATLAKFAMDVCLYAGQDFEFFKVDPRYATGSSIMPHKSNPDGFELVRAKCNVLQALPYELNMILVNLPSGYHRDLQILKERFIPALFSLKDCLRIVTAMTEALEVQQHVIESPKYEAIFSVEEVNKRVNAGMAFRDAYHEVSSQIKAGILNFDRDIQHTHIGSIGNLRNDLIQESFRKEYAFFE
ncbi:MAG: argininosuccinate lyase [Flammeovirgaceae bacterium]|jgi:argininosuccinate lyase|nr:argininosuccinate lyase [Flammeovirgaceae bacterium]|tara:strand:+ start:9061 stop:10353 length:1293 start_codon:yes stop_codon:yes gene_type:complete